MRALWIAVGLLGAWLGAAAAGAPSYAERVHERKLANGLKAIVLEDHKAPVGVFEVWYRVGSRNENLGRTGLSHLLEHMMFKGTERVGPEEYSRIIQQNGGNNNAFTSQDATTYFATLASDRLRVAVDLEADRMVNLTLDPALFGPERDVVAEERRLRSEDNPTAALFELIEATAYTAHPYQWPVIGWMKDIQKATRDDLVEHYRKYYTPGNAFVVAVGDVDVQVFLGTLEEAFGSLPQGSPPPEVRSEEPPQQGERRVVLRREAELPYIGIAYHVPSFPHPDSAALEVLARVLSGGKSARLHDALVYRKRLALMAGAWYESKSKDPTLFTLYAQPLPGKKISELEAALLEEVARLQEKAVEARELQKARNGLEAQFVFAQDSLFYQAMLLGQFEVLGDWRWIDRYLPAIRAVTAEDLQRVAAQYLVADNRTVGILEPLPYRRGRTPAAAAPGLGGPVH